MLTLGEEATEEVEDFTYLVSVVNTRGWAEGGLSLTEENILKSKVLCLKKKHDQDFQCNGQGRSSLERIETFVNSCLRRMFGGLKPLVG